MSLAKYAAIKDEASVTAGSMGEHRDGEDGSLLWIVPLGQPRGFGNNDTFFFEAQALAFGLAVMDA